jgi:multidrug efflux pump subunit AcrA (membrane-fusion protein)
MQMRTSALAGALTLSLLFATGCGPKAQQRQAPPPLTVKTTTAQTGSVQPTLSLPGIIAPLQDVALSTTLTEPTDTVTVQEGDHVRKGHVLAQLDTADLRANLVADIRTAQSDEAKTTQTVYNAQVSITQGSDQVSSSQAALVQAQTTLRNDQLNLSRDQQLLTGGFIAQQSVDTQQTQVRNDQQAVRNAQAALETANETERANGNGTTGGLQAANIAAARTAAQAAYAQADQIRTQIDKATIVSPVDGVVVNRNLNPGEYPGTRQIFTVQETAKVYAILNASTSNVFSTPVNAPVSVTIQGQGRPFAGRVVAVLDQLTPGSTNFAVKAEIDNPAFVLHSGMPVTGKITLAATQGITVPVTAFADDTHSSIFTLGSDDVAHLTKVSEVRTDGTNSIVTGLADGTEVVSNGQSGVTDGEKVARAGQPQKAASTSEATGTTAATTGQ